MDIHRTGFYVLWLTPMLLRVAIAVFMFRRRLYREFPAFFAYTVYHVLKTGFLVFLLRQGQWAYFYGFWMVEAFSFVLGLAVIYEILRHVLRPYDALWDLGRKLFLVVGTLLLLAGVVSLGGASALDFNAFTAWYFAAERGLRIVQCGLLAFLVLFSTYFGITWRHHLFGIALGLGVYASVELAATAVRSELGLIGHATYNLVRLMASACAALIWAAYLLRPEPARLQAERVPQHPVEEWNRALQELWQR